MLDFGLDWKFHEVIHLLFFFSSVPFDFDLDILSSHTLI